MYAAQFIKELAPKMGVPHSDLNVIDRHLANAGKREKASGRKYPHLTTKEAIRLPLAFMGSRMPSNSIKDLADIENFKFQVLGVEVEKGSIDALPNIIGISQTEIENMPLIDILVQIAQRTAAPWDSALRTSFGVKVNLGGQVDLQIMGGGFTGKLCFTGAMDHLPENDTMEFQRSATLGPRIIAWIGHVTKARNT